VSKAKTKSFEDSLRQRINEHFASRYGSKKPKIPGRYYLYYAVCLAVGFLFPAAIIGKYLGVFETGNDALIFSLLAIVSAIASSLTFMGFAHALSHNELFDQDSWAGRVLKFLSWDCLVTISEYVWDNVHNKSHHAFTNLKVGDAEKDLDVILITNNLKQQQSLAKVLFFISIAQVVRFFRQFPSIVRLHRNYEQIHAPELNVILAGKAYALAIFFVQPLVLTALSPLVLGERVGPRRWAAVVVGFIGDDEGVNTLPLDVVRVAHHGAFDHAEVHVDGVFDLGRADAVPGHVEHVVHPARDAVVAVLVAQTAVPS